MPSLWYDSKKLCDKEDIIMGNTENEKANIFSGGGYCLAEETWKKAWSEETHITEFAEKRIKSAKSAKMTPIKIDTEDLYGYFQGSHGRYETFLDTCPCGDFKRYNLPCKHIYRLAIELGLMNEKAETNSNAIPTPRKEKATLDEEIDIVETLSEQAQEVLERIAAGITSESPIVFEKNCAEIEELIKAGIIADTGEKKLIFGKRERIIELLESENIPYKKSDSVKILKQICEDNIKEKVMEKFGYQLGVTMPTQYTPRHIHYYLSRKESRYYYGDLPDDKITDQLIKRGYYKK